MKALIRMLGNTALITAGIFISLISCSILPAPWQITSDLSAQFSDIRDPEVVIDAAGNSVAIWSVFDAIDGDTLQGATLIANSLTWVPTNDLSDSTGSHALAVDSLGNVIAIWSEDLVGPGYNVVSSRLPAGSSTWDPSILVYAGLSDTDPNPQIAIDSAGNAVAVWSEDTAGSFLTKAATLPFGAGAWDPDSILSAAGTSSGTPQIAVDATGNAVAVWVQTTGPSSVIQASSYVSGIWSAATTISTAVPTTQNPLVAVNSSGDAVAIWNWNDGSGNNRVQGAQLPFGGAWTTPTTISSTPSDTNTAPALAMDAAGNTVVIWNQATGSSSTIKASTLAAGSNTWIPTADVGTSDLPGFASSVAIDGNGNATAAWVFDGNDWVIEVSTLVLGSTTWSSPTMLTPNVLGFQNISPNVAANTQGNVVVVWSGYRNGQGYASSVQGAVNQNPLVPLAPLNFTATSHKKVFATQTEYLNVLRWSKNPDGPTASSYTIFRNGIKIASVPATQFSYIDHNRKKGKKYLYSLVSVSESGESTPISAWNT